MLGKNSTKGVTQRAVSPYASRQSTGKMTDRPHFAHIQGPPGPFDGSQALRKGDINSECKLSGREVIGRYKLLLSAGE